MSNRTTAFLLVTVLLAIGILFVFNAMGTFKIDRPEKFLSRKTVRGMAVEHKNKLYTLNFEQQNQVIEMINRSIKIGPEGYFIGEHVINFDYSSLYIYLFDKPDIKISPVTIENQQLIFQAPAFQAAGLLRETGPGELHFLLSETYDTP